jgi:hypothetical protein
VQGDSDLREVFFRTVAVELRNKTGGLKPKKDGYNGWMHM